MLWTHREKSQFEEIYETNTDLEIDHGNDWNEEACRFVIEITKRVDYKKKSYQYCIKTSENSC